MSVECKKSSSFFKIHNFYRYFLTKPSHHINCDKQLNGMKNLSLHLKYFILITRFNYFKFLRQTEISFLRSKFM